jgi:hypothetical protein
MNTLPPLIELRAFDAAARHLSFKKAAAELGVTPTAIRSDCWSVIAGGLCSVGGRGLSR